MSMTNTDNKIDFPIQKRDWDEPMTEAELIQNYRLAFAKMMNLKAAGKYTPSLSDIRGIQKVNDICLKYGYPPIIKDISELQ